MSPAIGAEYRRLRALGWRASEAIRAARINVLFDDYEAQGLVSWRVVADWTPYDASYIDTWHDVRPSERERIKRETYARVNDEGHWAVVTLARKACGELHDVDSTCGFIGDDWRDSGYDVDLRAAALLACEVTP